MFKLIEKRQGQWDAGLPFGINVFKISVILYDRLFHLLTGLKIPSRTRQTAHGWLHLSAWHLFQYIVKKRFSTQHIVADGSDRIGNLPIEWSNRKRRTWIHKTFKVINFNLIRYHIWCINRYSISIYCFVLCHKAISRFAAKICPRGWNHHQRIGKSVCLINNRTMITMAEF